MGDLLILHEFIFLANNVYIEFGFPRYRIDVVRLIPDLPHR